MERMRNEEGKATPSTFNMISDVGGMEEEVLENGGGETFK